MNTNKDDRSKVKVILLGSTAPIVACSCTKDISAPRVRIAGFPKSPRERKEYSPAHRRTSSVFHLLKQAVEGTGRSREARFTPTDATQVANHRMQEAPMHFNTDKAIAYNSSRRCSLYH